ncbi:MULTISPECIES: outer membrane protein [unclassified Corallococcus]|uniref:outer membrane protein n=1 Tax=unclassified Corallococcus TaxID=2685029 RepID=UPI001A8D53DD|nr:MULTISPECIES: outer membrane beta-barrel protein [unclassified Corallococcus]MBN9683116.1 outer membrane beta-barrel protein [Corallococcus sp. NCSPR001]WAS85354.1 outer membrane beta-barrel protein [Corallococcus sp. NCRR]
MRRTSMVAGLVVAGTCVAGPAFAMDASEVSRKLSFSEQDATAGLDVGVGLGGYTGKLGDETGVGGLFNITANAQPWKYIGVEVGYEGQNIPIDDARVLGGNHIFRNNGTFMGKLGPVVDHKWHPFVGLGVGLSYLHASSGSKDVYNNDWQTEMPLAAGIEYRLGHLSAGVRATYRFVGGEELTQIPGTDEDAKGSLFNGNLTVGGRF